MNGCSGYPVPVTIRGVAYPSQSAAARALGVTPTTVWKALESGRLDTVGVRDWKCLRGRPWPNAPRKVSVNGVAFTSMSKAARAVKMHPETFRRKYREALLQHGNVTIEGFSVDQLLEATL